MQSCAPTARTLCRDLGSQLQPQRRQNGPDDRQQVHKAGKHGFSALLRDLENGRLPVHHAPHAHHQPEGASLCEGWSEGRRREAKESATW